MEKSPSQIVLYEFQDHTHLQRREPLCR